MTSISVGSAPPTPALPLEGGGRPSLLFFINLVKPLRRGIVLIGGFGVWDVGVFVGALSIDVDFFFVHFVRYPLKDREPLFYFAMIEITGCLWYNFTKGKCRLGRD